ncbi:MAG: pyridoxal phosphate-dependent aminotransferase [Bacteroidetes bacterium]|uniref:Pyridoxal phosphate-dependent aminotransferase n=1 Tax=Candidatus Cryptobacteroides avistercoris TaxID=2840758 RepID=A0A9D9IWD3_9BACT|nr:pyridoxal phosphate-dependent aminotransferase [Candidatus Cryptobacteroides avistercoris]
MKLFSDKLVAEACSACNVSDLSHATIGEILLAAQYLENKTGIPFVRMDQGSPGLPVNRYGVEAEKKALDSGICSQYPAAEGFNGLKEAASRFVKAFIDVDIDPRGCVPTTGSVEGTFAAFIACTQRIPGKDKVLFIDPGFPIQKSQLRILGIEWRNFDVYSWRGAEKLRSRLEEELASGDIAAIIYSNPDNPAWICLEEEELEVIGELATRYDAVVLEDLAYFCMDYRKELGRPFEPPYLPTVARYTDNYILLLSASKIFSYAGQRIAMMCISDGLFNRRYPALAERYHDSGVFGVTLTASILYMITSGCTYSTQFGYMEMLNLSCEGVIDFVGDTREYAARTRRIKEIMLRHGFHVVYDKDIAQPVGDGFFFTVGYEGLSGDELVVELMHYGVSCISLSTTGSLQQGVRGCSSRMREDLYPLLEERMAEFEKDHPVR